MVRTLIAALVLMLAGASSAQACRVRPCSTRTFAFPSPPVATPDEALVLKLKVTAVSPPQGGPGDWADALSERTATVLAVDQGWRPAKEVRIGAPDLLAYGDRPYPALGETAWMVGRMHRQPDGSQVFMPYAAASSSDGKHWGPGPRTLWMDPCDALCEHRRSAWR
jgi:hypothetical protein